MWFNHERCLFYFSDRKKNNLYHHPVQCQQHMPSRNFLILRICILSFSDIKLSLLPELSRSKIVMFSLTKRQLFYLNRYFDSKYSALSLWNTDIWGKLHWTLAHRSSSTVVAMILTCVGRGVGLGGLITIDTFFSENFKCQWI